jgi:hypothetical protein
VVEEVSDFGFSSQFRLCDESELGRKEIASFRGEIEIIIDLRKLHFDSQMAFVTSKI